MSADARKVRTLGKLLLKLETRSKTGSSRKLLLLNIAYLLPGIFLPLLLLKQNTDPTGFEYSFLTYMFYSLILSFTVISELDNIIISKTEAEIISFLPVANNLLTGAKMYMLLRYTLFLTLPLLVPGGLIYYSFMRSFPRTLMYMASGFMLLLFVVNIITLLYSIALRIFKSKKLSAYTLFFQVIMILALLMAYQLISFGITGKPGSSIASYISVLTGKGIIDFLPQAWFAFLSTRNTYILDIALILKLFLPFVICIASYFSLKMYLTDAYPVIRDKFIDSRIFDASSSAAGRKRFFLFEMVTDFIRKVYLRNNRERSSYGFISAMFHKDKTVRLAILPMLIIPAGLGLFALFTSQLPYPFTPDFAGTKPVFHISILLCVFVVINSAVLGVKISNFPGASWLYSALPLNSPKRFKNGFRKFFVVYLIIPVCLILFLIFIFKIPLDQALLHTLFIFSSANLYNTLCGLFGKALPFTKENTMLNSIQRLTSVFYPLVFGVVIVLIQLLVYKSMLSTVITILVLFTLTFWINYFGFVREKKSP